MGTTNQKKGHNVQRRRSEKQDASAQVFTPWQTATPYLAAILFFFAICLFSTSTAKASGVLMAAALLTAAFLCFEKLRARVTLPLLVLSLFVLMCGVSAFYAIAGKFALYEFLKVFSAFCLMIVLLALAPGEGTVSARWVAKVLAGASALAGLVSIDLLSTRFVSSAVLAILGGFTRDYTDLSGVEAGVRMTSLFTNPNVFAGCAGIGTLLALGLAVSAGDKRERFTDCLFLYVNALAFLLAFSMGATLSIICAFAVILLLERRRGTLPLMFGALALTAASAFLISQLSFSAWDGADPVPLACTVVGVAALALLDRMIGWKLAQKPDVSSGKTMLLILLAMLAGLAVFAYAAWTMTGGATLEQNGVLRRAAYPEAGDYTLSVEADAPLYVVVESQNRVETMMHTSSVLYEGDASTAAFHVPQDSLVVYFNFSAPEGAHIASAAYTGGQTGKIPLGYRLLPGFMANRLQGLLANENAIQRFVFFEDGMKLFRRSPIIGLGMGSFENAIKSVQPFYYETKYAHNHYIQTLIETGIVGLALFCGIFLVSAAALLRAREDQTAGSPRPELAGLLVFMMVHAAVEVVFSNYAYLPMAFGVIAVISLCCAGPAKMSLNKKTGTISLLAFCAVSLAFAVMFVGNIWAYRTVMAHTTRETLENAVKMDKFEWADYMLTYLEFGVDESVDDEAREKAAAYAEKLSRTESNSIPLFLARYYFKASAPDRAFAMLEKYVSYVASDERGWREAFHLLAQNDDGGEAYRTEALRLYGMMETWNAENIGTVTLDDEARAYLAQYQ